MRPSRSFVVAFKIKKASLTFRIEQKTFSMGMKNRDAYILLITTFNQSLSRISNVIKGHYSLLLSCNPYKIVFQHPLVVAFRRSSNLRDLLASTKIPSNPSNPNPSLPSGSFPCGKNIATCPYISDGLVHFFPSMTEIRTINSNPTRET